MKYSKYFLFLILALSFTSCFNSAKIQRDNKAFKLYMDSWLGAHISEVQLAENWGPPTSVYDDGKGGEIYSFRRSISDVYVRETWLGNYKLVDNSRTDFWEFYTNGYGIIIEYRYGSE